MLPITIRSFICNYCMCKTGGASDYFRLRWAARCCLKIPSDIRISDLPVGPWRVTKRVYVLKIMLRFFLFVEKVFHTKANGVKDRQVAGLPVNPDRLCLGRTKHHSWKAYRVLPGGEIVNCRLCWHSASYIQVKTCAIYHMSTKNTNILS